MLIPAFFYICWDVFFTSIRVWSFNPYFITGIKIFNLPVEEVLFFFVIPYCCVFIYECVRCWFPHLKDSKAASFILTLMGAILFITGISFFDKNYTGFTFVFTGVFIAILFLLRTYFIHFHVAAFLITFCISLVPFLIVNGLLTSIPVVVYNNGENLGIRINTIPFEDIFYGMLLMLLNIVIYEKIKNRT